MNLFNIFRLSFEALKERRVRAGLTILMVIMGGSLLVALDGTSNGFSIFVDSQFRSLGANVLILEPKGENVDFDDRLAEEISEIQGIDEAIPYIQQVALLNSKGTTQRAIVVGVEQTKLPLVFPTLSFVSGTYVSETDNVGTILGNEISRLPDSSDSFASLGGTVKFTIRDYIGQKAVVTEKAFIVRGVLSYIGSGIITGDGTAYISTSAAKKLFNKGDNYDGIFVITQSSDLNEGVVDSIRRQFGNDISITSSQQISTMIDKIGAGISLFVNVVAMVSLLVASVGIVTTLQTSVMERVKEIGLLKALGFNKQLILALFLVEAMVIGMIGGAIGVTLGVVLSNGMSGLLSEQLTASGIADVIIIPSFEVSQLAFTWFLCVALSMISGFYPSWRASRLDAVVALKNE